jgi:hypothetical protein
MFNLHITRKFKFKPEFLTIALLILVSSILILGIVSGLTTLKEEVSFLLIIVLLAFLTKDIKNNSFRRKPKDHSLKYIILVFLFCFVGLL